MAEDQVAENTGDKPPSPIKKHLFLFAAALLVPAVIGMVVFNLAIKPKLAMEPEPAIPADAIQPFPPTMTPVDFDEMHVSVQSEDPDLVAPLLIMQVSLSCADGPTAAKVLEKKQYFAAEILSLHQGRTRAELNDPLVQNSILEQIRQRANLLLKQLSPSMDLTVLKAMYLKFAIMDIG